MKKFNKFKQKGISLPMTLIMMVIMLLIGVAIYNSTESTGAVVNNISLKEAGVLASEAGINEAAQWLEDNFETLTENQVSNGYYAASPDILINDAASANLIDFTGIQTSSTTDDVNWEGGGANYYSAKKLTNKVSGFNVSYIIHRLCSQTGAYEASSNIVCSTSTGTSDGGSGDLIEGSEYGSYKITGVTQIAYRITAKAWGPKDSSSYIQSIILLANE